MKGLIKLGCICLFSIGLLGCSDSDGAGSATSTSSLQLPQQLEVVTNEND